MIKVWCEDCKGKGVKTIAVAKPNLRGIEYIHSSECETCKGKGYTEHEGSLEDLELAQAVKYFEGKENHEILMRNTIPNGALLFGELVTTHNKLYTIKQAIEMYREHKGGNHV